MLKILLSYNKQEGFSIFEVVIVIGLSSIIALITIFSLFTFRNNFEYDLLLSQIVESVNYSKTKAQAAKLDESNNRVAYGIKIFQDKIVEFEGLSYVEGADTNVEYVVPAGLYLDSNCTIEQNGEMVFIPVIGINSNPCTIDIYRIESADPLGSVVVGTYGIEEAN